MTRFTSFGDKISSSSRSSISDKSFWIDLCNVIGIWALLTKLWGSLVFKRPFEGLVTVQYLNGNDKSAPPPVGSHAKGTVHNLSDIELSRMPRMLQLPRVNEVEQAVPVTDTFDR